MVDTNGSKSEGLSKILNDIKPGTAAPTPPAEPEPESLTIAEMNGKYSTMRPANKNLTRLHVILKDGKVVTFQFNFLDARSTYEGGVFKLLFVGAKHWDLTVKGHGPLFWAIYDYISLHRWPYLREETGSMPGAGKGDDETVFTEIKITDVTPKQEA